MRELRIELEGHGDAQRLQCSRQIARILGLHRFIGQAVHQQHRRRIGTHVIDGLRFRIDGRRPEHVLHVRFEQRQEIIGSRQSNHARNARYGLAGSGEISRIERHQSCKVRTCRMAHQIKPRRIPAIVIGVNGGPLRRLRRIAHEPRHFDLRVVPIVCHHHNIAGLRKRSAHESIVRLVAVTPPSAMPQDHQRPGRIGRLGRHVDIQAVLRLRAVSNIGVAPVGAERGRRIRRKEPQALAALQEQRGKSGDRGAARHAIAVSGRHTWDGSRHRAGRAGSTSRAHHRRRARTKLRRFPV